MSEEKSDGQLPAIRPREVGAKIVATLGPASGSVEKVRDLVEAGVDVFRLNFSHGTREQHEAMLGAVREVASGQPEPVAIMGDLCGPKIRIGEVADGEVEVKKGDEIRLVEAGADGRGRIALNHPEAIADVDVGHAVLIDDGTKRFRVVGKTEGELVCRCEVGGCLRNNKGVNLPDSALRMGSLTDKDMADMRWAIENGVDFLALSFVRSARDVQKLRTALKDLGADVDIVSKIETPQAVRAIEEIIEESDAVLVARGDMGVEMDVARVPRIQKEITDRCVHAGKPVIIATQMLQTMVNEPVPTRAEVSDIANAIIDGADAVMLSAETSVGRYPVEAVEMMNRVAFEAETFEREHRPLATLGTERLGVSGAVAQAVATIAEQVDASVVAVWTERGELAKLVSKYRLDRPVVALTPSEAVRRRLALCFGVVSACADRPVEVQERIATVSRLLISSRWAAAGDTVVMGLSPQSMAYGETGSVVIHTVG